MIWGIRSSRVLFDHGFESGVILIHGEKISAFQSSAPEGTKVIDVGDFVVMAGIVDTHVHINEPGRTEWEGFKTATRAALAGGVTTVVDMPLNCTPVTTTAAALQEKRVALGQQHHVDMGFWGGVVPGNKSDIDGLVLSGVLGCKAYMIHSGIDEFPASDRATLEDAMHELKRLHVPMLVHAELDLDAPCSHKDPTDYKSYLESRPQQREVAAIELLIELCRKTGCAVHVVRLSAADALPAIASAKSEGLPITVETCPHYLCFSAEEIQNRQTVFKCAPPIRESYNRDRLWAALVDGTIDFIVSDHSPCLPALKKQDSGDFHDARGGIASLQLGLPAIWTEAKKRGIPINRLVSWLSTAPAKLAGLSHRKGLLKPGHDADIVIWDPESSFVLEPEHLRFRHKISPYLGKSFDGQIKSVYLRGRVAYHDGAIIGIAGGSTLLRGSL